MDVTVPPPAVEDIEIVLYELLETVPPPVLEVMTTTSALAMQEKNMVKNRNIFIVLFP